MGTKIEENLGVWPFIDLRVDMDYTMVSTNMENCWTVR